MLEEFTTNNARDFKQRYQGSFGTFLAESGKVLVRIDGVSDARVDFVGAKGEPYFVRPDSGYNFEFLPGTKKVFEHPNDNDLLLVTRIPARQWHRGIHRDNTRFLSLLGNGNYPVDFPLLESMVKEPRKPLDVRLKQYMSGGSNYAQINSMFSFVDRNVLVYDQRIGRINPADGKITLSSALLRAELIDALQPSTLDFKVV